MNYIIFLSEKASNFSLLGGKGLNLIKLIEIGVRIPPGFIINTKSYKKFLEESKYSNQLMKLLSKQFHLKEILQYSIKIRDLILKSKIPKKIIDEIRVAFDKIKGKIGSKISFAVRSSATIEDSKKFSFAGQADTYLYNNNIHDIIASLKNCWLSLFSPQSLLYILQMRKKGLNISLSDIHMAVIVQQMVNSQISGVFFTANVINNDSNQMLINSTWGLGNTIADDLIIPDTIIIKKNQFEIIKRIIGKKEKKSIKNPKGSYTILIETDAQSRKVCSINEKQLRQLHNLGLKIENAMQFPQDIEWAIENDKIYILQSRPITTLKK